jgi:NSS family neurotransmitter:Na+ symporter
MGMKRSTSIAVIVGCAYLLGIPAARSLNILSNQDFVWGNALVISGVFIAFAVLKYGGRKLRYDEILADTQDWNLGRWWETLLKYWVPVAATALLVWWFSLSAATTRWFDPFEPFSIMTCVIQWILIFVILFLLNRFLSERTIQPTKTS